MALNEEVGIHHPLRLSSFQSYALQLHTEIATRKVFNFFWQEARGLYACMISGYLSTCFIVWYCAFCAENVAVRRWCTTLSKGCGSVDGGQVRRRCKLLPWPARRRLRRPVDCGPGRASERGGEGDLARAGCGGAQRHPQPESPRFAMLDLAAPSCGDLVAVSSPRPPRHGNFGNCCPPSSGGNRESPESPGSPESPEYPEFPEFRNFWNLRSFVPAFFPW
jgi:hypothetical protein